MSLTSSPSVATARARPTPTGPREPRPGTDPGSGRPGRCRLQAPPFVLRVGHSAGSGLYRPRCVGLQRARDLGLRAEVEVTDARKPLAAAERDESFSAR